MAVQKLVDEFKASGADLIVACGGGSVMDAAKLCSLLKGSDYTVKDLLDNPLLASKQLKTVMIPTTCGHRLRGHLQRHRGHPGGAVKKGHCERRK